MLDVDSSQRVSGYRQSDLREMSLKLSDLGFAAAARKLTAT